MFGRLFKPIMRRSFDPRQGIGGAGAAAWYRPGVGVTGTLAASNWADQSGNGRDLVQASGANQPIYLPFTGTKYGYLPGVNGNYFSSPSAAANQITSDIDVRACVALDAPSGTYQMLISKWDGTSDTYRFFKTDADAITFAWVDSGGTGRALSSTATISFVSGVAQWVRVTLDVDNGSSNADAYFYTSTDGTTWTQLGALVQFGSTTTIKANTAALNVGADLTGIGNKLIGKVFRAQIYNGINGTLAVDFNASDWSETSTNAATQVSSTTGET